MREVQLVGPAYADESLTFSAQDTVNWIPVPDESGQARSNIQLRGLPGMTAVAVTVSPVALTTNATGGTKGVAYSATFTASGGTSPYRYSVAFGLLPPGVTLNASTGVISGTPSKAGTYEFTVSAEDANNLPASLFASVVIAP